VGGGGWWWVVVGGGGWWWVVVGGGGWWWVVVVGRSHSVRVRICKETKAKCAEDEAKKARG
jgi:hypothetical protein